MQYQAGSWYLPWGIPMQKMITMPYAQQGSAPMDPYLDTNSASLTYHLLSNPHQAKVNTTIVSPIQVQATTPTGTQNYQLANFSPHAVGKFARANIVDNLHGIASVSSVQRPSVCIESTIQAHHRNVLIPPKIFAPLTLSTYFTSPTAAHAAAINNSTAGTSIRLTSPRDSTRIVSQQRTSHRTSSATSPLACISSSVTPNPTIPTSLNFNVDVVAMRHHVSNVNAPPHNIPISMTKIPFIQDATNNYDEVDNSDSCSQYFETEYEFTDLENDFGFIPDIMM